MVELEGVKLEPTAQVGGAALQLNGADLRTRAIFKVHVAGLYVPQKSAEPARCWRRRAREAQVAALKSQTDTLNANLKAVGEAKKGDVIHFEYLPDSGTRVTVNGHARGTAIPGEDFFTAVMRVWIGDKPVDGDVKKGLTRG